MTAHMVDALRDYRQKFTIEVTPFFPALSLASMEHGRFDTISLCVVYTYLGALW